MTLDDDPLRAAAVLLAGQDPSGWRRLLTAHRADASGHCPACRLAASGAAPVWPCQLAIIAELAEELSAAAPHVGSPGGSRPPDTRKRR